MNPFKDTTDLMVYGHEAWLEASSSHGHMGEKTTIYLKWGHNMKPDGLVRREGMEAFVQTPGGQRQSVTIDEGGPEQHLVAFTPATDGLYQVVTRREGHYVLDQKGRHIEGTRREHPQAQKAVYFNQFAQVIIPVGHDLEGTPPSINTDLEIKAQHWQHWRAGDTLNLTVQHQGQPLDGISVDIVQEGPSGYQQQEMLTGLDGGLAIQAATPGRYLAIARYRIPAEENNSYDELSLTATLAFMVTR